MYKLRDLNSTTQDNSTTILSPLQLGFTSYLCVTSLVPSTVVLLLNAFFGHNLTFKLRIAGGLFGVILLFSFTTALVQIDTDSCEDIFITKEFSKNDFLFCLGQMTFYGITLSSAFFINVVSSVFQGGICGLAGKFPPGYIQAVISGQALGGIFASAANIGSIALGASAVESAFIYFLAADVTLLISFGLYFALSTGHFFVHHAQQSNGSGGRSCNDDHIISAGISYGRIIRRIWPYLAAVCLTYVVTLALYPAVAVLVHSADRGHGYAWNDVYFTPVACFLLLNVGDYVGRFSAALVPMPSCCSPKFWILGLSILRMALVPLMMVCNAQPRSHLPVLIETDGGFMGLMALLALSNGYLSTACFSMAPRSVSGDEQETASSLMAAFLGIGLALGGALSSAVVHIL